MRSNDWHLTDDLDTFLTRTRDFLRSRPALHNTPLTTAETLRTRGMKAFGEGDSLLGWLERGGEVTAVFYSLPSRVLSLTSLSVEEADSLAAHLDGLGHTFPGVGGERDTALAFAEAWRKHTGATPTLRQPYHLYRLGTLTPPEPFPEGRGRLAGARDREQLFRFLGEFLTAVGEAPGFVDADTWAGSRFAEKHFTFWETPDGTPVSLAGSTSMIGGMVRVDPVYTPVHLRGRGYAGAVSAEVTRAALEAGATDVVLYADPANPTSNALYQRLGYELLAHWSAYDFTPAAANTD
ncbi:GNAT family N-acetyltransferase [Streptomyces sp. NPDC002643]